MPIIPSSNQYNVSNSNNDSEKLRSDKKSNSLKLDSIPSISLSSSTKIKHIEQNNDKVVNSNFKTDW